MEPEVHGNHELCAMTKVHKFTYSARWLVPLIVVVATVMALTVGLGGG